MKRTLPFITLLVLAMLLTTGCETWDKMFAKNGNDVDADALTDDADTSDGTPEIETNEQITIRRQRELIDKQTEEIAELETNNITLANEILQLQDEIKFTELENDNLKAQIDAVSSAVSERNELEGKLAAMELEMFELRDKLVASELKIGELETQLSEMTPETIIDDVEPDVDEVEFEDLPGDVLPDGDTLDVPADADPVG